jgi:hypothetical protein
MEIVKRRGDVKGFVVLPPRWVVERTFSWFGRNQRLAKDFENLAETLATFVTLASIQLALRRLARASVANSTNYRFAMRYGGGPQRVGERSFAGTRGNGKVAPIPAVRVTLIEPRESTLSGHSDL